MLFLPPRCPRTDCVAHSKPPFHFQRRGFFLRKCDGRPVQRFRCLHCRRYFSSQSFRLDYRLKLPYLHLELFWHFISKVTLRQAARMTGHSRVTIEHRLRLLGDHCRAFQRLRLERFRGSLSGDVVLDELETFEQNRLEKPLTVPVAIDRTSYFVWGAAVGTLPARPSARSRREQQLGLRSWLRTTRRESQSKEVVSAVLQGIAELVHPQSQPLITSDQKPLYALLVRDIFGGRAQHSRISGRRRRTIENPLFPINHCLAMLRDGLSRLVRKNWAHAKLAERLERHLWIWICYRNYVRTKTNKTPGVTAAMAFGVEQRLWTVEGLLRWNPLVAF